MHRSRCPRPKSCSSTTVFHVTTLRRSRMPHRYLESGDNLCFDRKGSCKLRAPSVLRRHPRKSCKLHMCAYTGCNPLVGRTLPSTMEPVSSPATRPPGRSRKHRNSMDIPCNHRDVCSSGRIAQVVSLAVQVLEWAPARPVLDSAPRPMLRSCCR